jgi:ADP-heptose:LPS heptosyltransferase
MNFFNFKYVIRKRQIGDALWIEPVIRELAKRYSKVYVHTKYNDLFKNYPIPNVIFKNRLSFIEKVLSKIERFLHTTFFFVNLEMSYEESPQEHFLHAYQHAAHLPLTDEYPKLYLSQEEINKKIVPFDKYVVLHRDSVHSKNFRKIFGVNWELIISYINSRGFKVVTLEERSINIGEGKSIPTTLRDLMSVIYHSSFFIGIDSGPSHFAASLGIPALIFFGSVNPLLRHFPKVLKGFFLQQPCEFAGCYHSSVNKEGVRCRLVGDDGIPKCSLHSSEFVIKNINLLLKQFLPDA